METNCLASNVDQFRQAEVKAKAGESNLKKFTTIFLQMFCMNKRIGLKTSVFGILTLKYDVTPFYYSILG